MVLVRIASSATAHRIPAKLTHHPTLPQTHLNMPTVSQKKLQLHKTQNIFGNLYEVQNTFHQFFLLHESMVAQSGLIHLYLDDPKTGTIRREEKRIGISADFQFQSEDMAGGNSNIFIYFSFSTPILGVS